MALGLPSFASAATALFLQSGSVIKPLQLVQVALKSQVLKQ